MEYINLAETVARIFDAAGDGVMVLLVGIVLWKAVGWLSRV